MEFDFTKLNLGKKAEPEDDNSTPLADIILGKDEPKDAAERIKEEEELIRELKEQTRIARERQNVEKELEEAQEQIKKLEAENKLLYKTIDDLQTAFFHLSEAQKVRNEGAIDDET